jgi:isopentenyl diphosphate isomerase/L-lactate dehydrogenase-like FMN-dependent dehydrogenase
VNSWDRRAFLHFLAASPLTGGLPDWARGVLAAHQGRGGDSTAERQGPQFIGRAADALEVFDFEPVARANMRGSHWGYLSTGVDNEDTLRANREGFQRFALRSRRMVNVSTIDTKITVFGETYDSPVFVCPTSSGKAFHLDGELAVSRASRAGNHLQMLSTVATVSIEDAIAARGGPVWFQFYPPRDWEAAKKMAKRAEAAGSPVLVLTVDLNAGSNRVTLARATRGGQSAPGCTGCHGDASPITNVSRKPMFDGLGPTAVPYGDPAMTWEIVKRLRDAVKMKLVIKGLATREDAELAMRAGVDGVYVSNHGGRSDDGGRSSIECLPEITEVVRGRVPVFFDSGVRRGTDVVKALALGATAVGIGRPYLWGLGAFGQAGVERVFTIMRAETRGAMAHIGATSVRGITRASVTASGRA